MRKQNERGSFTIEAILSLSIFMFAFMAIVSLATIAKVESTTQYAIDQVAKEVAQYYYIAERVGMKDKFVDVNAAIPVIMVEPFKRILRLLNNLNNGAMIVLTQILNCH